MMIENHVLPDVNECEMEEDVCENGECDNTLGSFMSRCEEGYSAKPDSGPGCTDDDECELDSYNCDMNADRINIPVCILGYISACMAVSIRALISVAVEMVSLVMVLIAEMLMNASLIMVAVIRMLSASTLRVHSR